MPGKSVSSLAHFPRTFDLYFAMIISTIVLFLTVFYHSASATSSVSNVTITAWQYCQGCKITVDIYSKVAARELKLLDKLPAGQRKILDAAKVVDHLCDNSMFYQYGEFGSYSCIKVLDDENRQKFLEEFAGTTSMNGLLNKRGIYDKKKKICMDITKACPASQFDDNTIVGSKRNKCAACTVIANDIDAAKRARNVSSVTLRSILENEEPSFCNSLGYNHNPYSWLESLCDEMLENKLESILEVVAFHDQVASTGLTPDQTMVQMMCEEFYGCDKDLEQAKKPKKAAKKGKQAKKPVAARGGSTSSQRKDL